MAPMRRKSHGSIRSPHVKRDSQSQVTIEGWLFKLEGGTIKQWKQRWCVLADFCLFLYKGPNEDKVSSSVLLPSYKISPCNIDDRVTKKFAFKAEHQNMKTFYFAAEDKDSMKRWMNMMSLATIMQKCLLSDQLDPSFSSVSNDDEDSGFTSYRSRRFKSQEHNSTFDSSFGGTEPLKQRSSSYGDRMGEVHLGSGDKYPNVYKSSSSHLYKASPANQEIPRRQPLYANAPPKPRRLTQSDPFTISPGERYDAIDHDASIIDSSQYHYDERHYYPQFSENNPAYYHNQASINDSFNDSVFQEPVTVHYDASFAQNSSFQNIPDLHKPQPPRPHSADFLERDTEGFTPVPINYCEKPQPQRPKSSLECYNQFWGAEEYDFDDYREAVRAQADNLYANKIPHRNHNSHKVQQRGENMTNSDQRLNIHYVRNSFPSVKQTVSQYESRERFSNCSRERLSSVNSENNSYADHSKPKRSHEESMKRLLEWKQRMLQSPLARRNNGRTNSSSETCSPVRQPVQNEYQWQVMQELESYEANLRKHSLYNTNYESSANELHRSHHQHLQGYGNHLNDFENSYERQNHHNVKDYGSELLADSKEDSSRGAPGKLSSSDNVRENFEPEKVMYCVDSENNEILFSCDDSSFSEQNISKPIQCTHYSPQMHSFSTMSNVNDISNDTHITPESGKHQRSRGLTVKARYNQGGNHEHQGSNASHPTVITYSSDDEDNSKEDCGMMHLPQTTEELEDTNFENFEGQAIQSEWPKSASPDYVNISMVSKDWEQRPDWEQGTYSEVISKKSQLHCLGSPDKELKPCENYYVESPIGIVENSDQVKTVFEDSQISSEACVGNPDNVIIRQKLRKAESECVVKEPPRNIVSPSMSPSKKSYEQNDFYDDGDFGIKREDYYRASQIFYASTRMKNRSQISSSYLRQKRNSEKSDCSDSTVEYSSIEGQQKFKPNRYQNLDKDVGLPLPVCKTSPTKSQVSVSKTVESQTPQKVGCIKFDEYLPHKKDSPKEINQVQQSISSNTTQILDVEHSKTTENVKENSHSNVICFANDTALKKNLSYEEMRVQLRRKMEAPPPNIVQERIKCFESVASSQKKDKKQPTGENLVKSSSADNFSGKDNYENRGIAKRIRHKVSHRTRAAKRSLHSDSEAVVIDDSDESSDDLTMRSAPILLSPLSSVLADLRKTADSGKEKPKPVIKDPAPLPMNSMRDYFRAFNDVLDVEKSAVVENDSKSSASNIIDSFDLDPNTNNCEAEYLPMSGLKQLDEPEYVTMNGGKLSRNNSCEAKYKNEKETDKEEHLYNEPFSPPPSFLHDVYEKQKAKQMQFQMNSSSEDSLTENIYEKPIYRFPSASCMRKFESLQNTFSLKPAVPEANPVLMTSYSCSNVTSVGKSSEIDNSFPNFRTSSKASEHHHYEQAHLSISVPDLLQLQEIKDSDASDADDEASRDFDTTGFTHLPSYQSPILDHFYASDRSFASGYDGHSSFDSVAHSLSHLENASYITPNNANSSTVPYFRNEDKSLLYKPESDIPPYSDMLHPPHRNIKCEGSTDDEKKIHVRKLRVYTKGKKPEAPKIFPVPLNIEEPEILRNTDNRDDDNPPCISMAYHVQVPSLPVVPKCIENTFSDNVAYLSREEISKGMNVAPIELPVSSHQSSFTPDVVPSVCTEGRLPCESMSPLSRSPNSAPYYYSDLLSGHNVNFLDQIPVLKRNEMLQMEKSTSPKSSTSLLNNVRSKSPSNSCKGDIGRKVNKINSKEALPESKINSKVIPWKEEDGIKSNLKYTVDMFQYSESKYLDAEKNKYEAGHTLEKTRSNSTMAVFKQQSSSTSEIKIPQLQSVEPVYENIIFQQKPNLQKRLSQSLEGIPHVVEANNEFSEHYERSTSPVYENIDFFLQKESSLDKNVDSSTHYKSEKIKPDSPNLFVSKTMETSLAEKQFCQSNVPALDKLQNVEAYDFEADYLDQNLLRRVSEQHFFGKNASGRFSFRDKSSINSKNVISPPMQNNVFKSDVSSKVIKYINDDRPVIQPEFTENVSCSNCADEPHENFSNKVNESESSSDASSSCDEASADSDNRHQLQNNKFKYSAHKINDTYDPVFQAREPLHLKKLVKQSEGLMSKGKRLSVSAGDLLGKTHEELVLLLIQLRRNQSKLLSAKEKCKQQFGDEQQLLKISSNGQKGYTKNYNELLRQVRQLENQYDVTQPLVTLVDNMVKLGSLYGSSDRRSSSCPRLDIPREENTDAVEDLYISDRFGDSSILSKLLAEENNLQRHMTEIYCLDKGLRHETNSISSLQQDKEMLESTLYGMRNKILDHQDRPVELQKLRKQQRMIEKELIRVKKLLSNSAKKIEDASIKNDQLEQEILLLRQRLQQALKTDSSETKTSQHNRADLEAELTRVQNVLEELANHRHEINNTVEKLKREAHTKISKGTEVRASPTGVAGSAPLPLRKKQHSMYLETDLDTMFTQDLAVVQERDLDDIPVYVNAEEINNPNEDASKDLNTSSESLQTFIPQSDSDFSSQCALQDINDADERMKRFYGILPKEKPCEIKTVRIVKRQSERRNRERDKKRVTYDDQSSVWVVEEPDISSDDHLDIDEGISQKISSSPSSRPSTINLLTSNSQSQSNSRSAHERLFGNSSKRDKITPSGSLDSLNSAKRSKRRHYTVSGYQYMLDPQFSQYFRDRPRSRDDVDMERCLRTANTPDIVRSTIKKKEVFDDKIIERELGLPDKISIPERYIENEPEQLSAGEKLRRSLKAENICKMLSETTATYGDVVVEERSKSPETLHKKLSEEKKKRAHLLSLNRALAREVAERTKAVAANVYCPESSTSS